MKTTTRRWLLAATAAAALVGCSSGEAHQGVAPEDTVAPVDGDSSPETTRAPDETFTSGDLDDEAEAILEKHGIHPENARKAFDEIMAAAWEASRTGAPQTEEEGAELMKSILDKYGIDPEDFATAYGEMIRAGS
jgi:hypothetical protein